MTPRKLNYFRFLKQLERFRKMVKAHDGAEFSSFASGQPYQEEHYKEVIYHEARRRLAWLDWREVEVGTGTILRRVIDAIEIKDSNLVDWDKRRGEENRSHHSLCLALETKNQLVSWESLFYDFYRGNLSAEETFPELLKLLDKKRYDIVAYLYFLKDWSLFAPISPERFDVAFAKMGLDLKTSRQCSWENYQAYNKALRLVRDALRCECYDDIRLIDAHSFCWMISKNPTSEDEAGTNISPPEPFENVLVVAVDEPKPVDNAPAIRPAIDWEALRRNQAEVGKLSESVALESERLRLIQEGRPDLAAKVYSVSDDHNFGYDIKSFNADGTDRYIEVKTARLENGVVSFYLSENERCQSRQLGSYFFYLVFDPRGERCVKLLPAGNLAEELLSPIVHLARFTEPSVRVLA